MVLIGGITRLTDSGLSMSTWNLLGGAPPLNLEEWQDAFNIYKETPEGKVNSHFILEDFKRIFFWEYLHRMMGRLLGLVFIIPFVYFLIKKRLSKKLIIQSSLLLIMGGVQGLIGWWMVKSGLVDKPDVSHFRLAVHLITAFLTCAYTFWVALSLIFPKHKTESPLMFKPLLILFILVIIQIIYGAFVAGLKAGRIYTTWPKMGNQWIPESVVLDPGAQAQFIHRTLAIIILGFTLYIWKKKQNIKISKTSNAAVNTVVTIIIIQVLLGIFTLIMSAPITLALIHQIIAFLLLMSLVWCLFIFKKS